MVTKNMDLEAVIMTVIVTALGVVMQTFVIVWLYNHYIIPKIVMRVKDELVQKMEEWVADLKTNLAENVKEAVQNGIDYLRDWIAGKRGSDARQLSIAKSYLDNRLPQDPDDDAAGWDEIITQGVIKYGRPIIEAALRSVRPKAAAAHNESAANDGWC